MESNLGQSFIQSPYFNTYNFQKQVELIKNASEIAQKKIDYHSAHSENIIRAIDVVEDFLKRKHRLCYGGQAINAHLPAKYKFYDPEYSIPDYDFFSPDQTNDIRQLVRDLRKAGFNEISVREGMHEGTLKVYVDFIPVADMTHIDNKLYKILSIREYRYDGISYLDANTLRMLMYLELSRPRGEVTRWEKVYERLMLFNEFVESKPCHIFSSIFKNVLHENEPQYIMKYIIDNKKIFAGAELAGFYKKSLYKGRQNTEWVLTSKKPIIFLSNNPMEDAKQIKAELDFMAEESNTHTEHNTIHVRSSSSKGAELIPSMKILVRNEKAMVIIIEEVACHSYYNVALNDGNLLKIATMDTLITLYFSFGLVESKYLDMGSMECLANELVNISIKSRKHHNKFPFPFISLKCIGHQTSLPSLIRAKVKRITLKKKKIEGLLENNSRNSIKNIKNRTTSKTSK
jgi:hypothetical protein